jgi:hypothetical protein
MTFDSALAEDMIKPQKKRNNNDRFKITLKQTVAYTLRGVLCFI